MKNKIETALTVTAAILACIVMVLVLFSGKFSHEKNPASTLYPMTAIVTEILETKNAVIIKNYNGQEWTFEGIEDWIVGDVCALIMDNQNTPEIKDDVIVQVKYGGYFERWDF